MPAEPVTPRAVLTDVEGTTTAIGFVADTLFPYARAHLVAYAAAHPLDVAPILAEVSELAPGDPLTTLLAWLDEDRKATPLKTLQGMIWAEGYRSGAFKGHVYSDAVAALTRWHAAGVPLFVFSSGSVAAQRLLFAHSGVGDLSGLFAGHFDTTSGAKHDPASYRTIAAAIGMPAADILFVSDSAVEVEAAAAAGFVTRLIDRGNARPGAIASFDPIVDLIAPVAA